MGAEDFADSLNNKQSATKSSQYTDYYYSMNNIESSTHRDVCANFYAIKKDAIKLACLVMHNLNGQRWNAIFANILR